MRIPNADQAIIAPEKLLDYLLNPQHRRGGSKARLFSSMGFGSDHWAGLEAEIRLRHLTADVERESDNQYGRRYEIVAPLVGINGRVVRFRSIWQVDTGTVIPRLITMYPE